MDYLGFEFLPLGHGRYRYRQGFSAAGNAVQVFFDGCQEGMGVHVQISGEGCRLLEAREGFPGWQEQVEIWLALGATFTRLDLAIDERSGRITIETVRQAMCNRDYASRTKVWKDIQEHHADGVRPTIYAGKRTGGTMMRCYDKAAQLGEAGPWLRFEFEYQSKKAHALAQTFVESGLDAAVGSVRSFIEFKDPNHKTTDITRRRPARWWNWLIHASKHRLVVTKTASSSLLRTYTHFVKQNKRTLYVLMEAHNGDVQWLRDLAEQGRLCLDERHKHMLIAARTTEVALP